MYLRVVHRRGWEVELVEEGEKRSFGSREEAMAFARSLAPDWIELGELIPEREGVPQHHRWTTLRKRPDGSYSDSGLGWGGRRLAG